MAKAVIKDVRDQKLISINTKSYNSKIYQKLPFRVKFINIGIEPSGPGLPPPIGIAVIGFNNYIL